MESKSLYQLTEEFVQIQSMMESENDQAFIDTLDSIDWEKNFEEKCDGYVMVIRNTEVSIGADKGQIEVIEKILDELKSGVKTKENHIKRMKESLYGAMIKVGKTKFDSQRFKYWTQKTTPAMVLNEGKTVPLDYMTNPAPEIDKAKITKDLKAGVKLDFAHLEQREIVRFK